MGNNLILCGPPCAQKQESVYAPKSDDRTESTNYRDSLRNQTLSYQRTDLRSFKILKLIGQGAYGKVKLVEKIDTKEIFAMKVVRKEEIDKMGAAECILREKMILQQVNCDFIVKLHYSFQNERKFYFIIDFLNGGDLYFHLRQRGRFSEQVAKFFIAEIILAIEYLHSKNVAYRDLKPENVLLDSKGHIKLIDFGLSKTNLKEGSSTATFCGTPEYMAPEIVIEGSQHNKAVDFWSIGVVLYEFLTGKTPFFNQDQDQLSQQILTKKLEKPTYMSEKAFSLIQGLLTKESFNRLGCKTKKGFQEIKSHPFFADINWERLKKKQINSPYVPKVKSAKDTKYFQKEMLSRNPEESVFEPQKNLEEFNRFSEFSFSREGDPDSDTVKM